MHQWDSSPISDRMRFLCYSCFYGSYTHTAYRQAAPALRIYPLETGAPLVLSVALPYAGCVEGEALILMTESTLGTTSSLPYWSPRDPNRVRSLDLGNWKLRSVDNDYLLFVCGKESLLWRWGSAIAVRPDLEIPDFYGRDMSEDETDVKVCVRKVCAFVRVVVCSLVYCVVLLCCVVLRCIVLRVLF